MDFEYTAVTTKSVDEVVEALKDALKGHKFGVLWDFDLAGTLQSKGIEYNSPYRILEVCNPKVAGEVVSTNAKAGYFLPCKMVVYEENGKTLIGLTKPTTLIGLAGDSRLASYAEDVETSLTQAIDEVK
ncbi:DUF302 domain-containing protein [Alicyclobacillus sp. SO9]|uniref:DUF302 domain-containing protein n=1 Tax=Alicyclobacillus sp. SO9 TaxID=2665646 RepID=UPI0018E73321|nr:DUF302 domain-containing protein [Alicyclobacillus sp. SO9]QQE80149.1 DUF302 domain-containing protein [Alicyclobacillus sp. SO9]